MVTTTDMASSSSKPKKLIDIALFKGLCFFMILLAFFVINFYELKNIDEIASKTAEIRGKSLPVLLESQKSLVNIESLRRIAETINASEDQMTRRKARIRAAALTAESIFDEDPDFRTSISKLIKNITKLETIRTKVIKQQELIELFDVQFFRLSSLLLFSAKNETDKNDLLRLSSRHSHLNIRKASGNSANEEALITRQLEELSSICLRMSKEPGGSHVLLLILPLARVANEQTLLALRTGLKFNKEATELWAYIDNELRVLRDTVTTGTELSISQSLMSIKITANSIFNSSIVLYCLIILIILLSYYLEHRLISKPLRWTTQKLHDLQDGVLDTKVPKIYIKEIAAFVDLLDRFSLHLAELYSQTDQLREDAADKRNLEAVMRAVFSASLDGYIVWNSKEIYKVSEEAVTLLGFHSTENFIQYLKSAWDVEAKFANLTEHGAALREEKNVKRADGENLPCELTHLIINYNDQLAILTYLRDLREQKKNESALRIAKEEAEVATKAKGEFLARMSHEIRTPMNGVIGLTQLALNDSPSPRQKELLGKIQSSAKILLGVINDILDFSKMEQGKLVLESRPFRIGGIMPTIHDLLMPLADSRDIDFNYTLDSCISPDTMLVGDPLRLSQVLLNLCSNGIKFTEKGGVHLNIACVERTPTSLTVLFSVEDTGIGIPYEQVDMLFQPFTQADSSTTRKYGGTGLGLMICKLLVEQMGGMITVSSIQGKGSSFSFVLELPLAAEQAAATDEPLHNISALDGADFSGKTVLVVEDNAINQEIIVALLENHDIKVTVANNGKEAVEACTKVDFDLIFMDIQMPIMDGLEATALIRKNHKDKAKHVPIIAMTAHAMQEDVQKSLDAGMNAHLTKPIDFTAFEACLQEFLI